MISNFSIAAFFIYKIIKANKDRQSAKEEKRKKKQEKKKKWKHYNGELF